MSAKRGLRIRGLRQRWLVNAVLPIVLVVIAIVTVYTLGVRRTYYSAMRSGLETRARVAADNFSSYGLKSYSEYFRYASITAETFEEKDRLELQFINVNGRVQVSSYGLTAGTQPGTSDVTEAVATGKPASFEGLDPQTGERILSVSAPLRFNGRVIGVLRYVTALHEADRSVLVSMAVAIGVALLCVGLAIFSNAIFINNVVEPVAVVSDAARRISAGSYGILIDNHYRDELGELVDNINDMSLKISQSEKIQQEFVSSVSHELRTPMAVIMAQCEDALSGEKTGADYREALSVIHRQGRRMNRMISGMLELVRMERKTDRYAREPFNLSALTESVCEDMALICEKNIALTTDVEPDISITGDQTLITRLLGNLIGNAYRYGRENGHIIVTLHRAGSAIELTVSDDGIGIAPDQQKKIFRRLYQGASERSGDGAGLGLAMARQIARLHGGELTVVSEEGKGSAFTARFPMQ